MAKGSTVASNVSVTGNSVPLTWTGGRAALILHATTFPTTTNLQMLGMDGGTTWINVTSTNLTTAGNQVTLFDLPAGQYRLALTGGTVAGLYAALVSVSYN